MKNLLLISLNLFSVCLAEPVSLFNGKNLDGWEIPENQKKWWKVEDGKIVGGSLDEPVPLNTYLTTKNRYDNFDLRFKVKLTQVEGFTNSGIQVRSERKGGGVTGYQVDAGKGFWGTIWDEHRRNKIIAPCLDPAAASEKIHDFDWNEYRILCEGKRIRTWINGVFVIDYTEDDPSIPLEGIIGLQAHKGGKFTVEYKDITIEKLDGVIESDPTSPEAEKASFIVPENFEIELVASELQGVNKPVTVTWDTSGRMWTMTAVEYPVDANENLAHAEALYAKGGKDRVLVFDQPFGPGPHTPRVFADGLVIPLGMLPTEKGALVQYGKEVRHYIDDNQDGKSDRHEVLLEGFGIQDSHLFPHQFEYGPGGWVYMAQGLFNQSEVRRPGGKLFANQKESVPYKQCKLARFRRDGTEFELLTSGPNNIWGFETDRDGEMFLQEANDMRYPVAEFVHGTQYKASRQEYLRSYAPFLPQATTTPLGGSGLSGIAIANDKNSAFASAYQGRRTFYIANPITNRIQVVTLTQDEKGRPSYQLEKDFMTSGDTSFRPIAVRFGPDGNMYVVDWYNKIISHNEVPRTHPDRDKTRGRIWRIKPKGVAPYEVPNLAKANSSVLIDSLNHPSAALSRLAWQEIGRRKDESMLGDLVSIVSDNKMELPKRLAAFWALEEKGKLDLVSLGKWSQDSSRHLRYEAVRAAGELQSIDDQSFVKFLQAGEKDYRVKSMAAKSLRTKNKVSAESLSSLLPFIANPIHIANARDKYEQEFINYQIRWAFETHQAASKELLNRQNLRLDEKSLLILSLAPEEGAIKMAQILSQFDRAPNYEEINLLGSQLKLPEVSAAFALLLQNESQKKSALGFLLNLDVSAASDVSLRKIVIEAVSSLDLKEHKLILSLARKFRLTEISSLVEKLSSSGLVGQLEILKTYNEMGSSSIKFYEPFLLDPNPEIQREAMIGYSAQAGELGVEKLHSIWNQLPGVLRILSLEGILKTKESTEALVNSILQGNFKNMEISTLERASALLGTDHPSIIKLSELQAGLFMPVFAMNQGRANEIPLKLDLAETFTLESWVNLNSDINQSDSLLGKQGEIDFNFFQGKLHVHVAKKGNLIVASRPIAADVWTHVAVTRDQHGKMSLYLDGELDAEVENKTTQPFLGLTPGVSFSANQTSGRLAAFRVWNRALPEKSILDAHRIIYQKQSLPEGLIFNLSDGAPGASMSSEFPVLRTQKEAELINEKFATTKVKAEKIGKIENGYQLAKASCFICHQVKGEGMAIGPDLTGAGAMGIDSLLRNILQPNDQLESGYYRHDIVLQDGSSVSGFFSSENAKQIILRQIGADDRAIPKNQITSHQVSKRSLMPEGLIAAYSDEQVADLFTYLLSLK